MHPLLDFHFSDLNPLLPICLGSIFISVNLWPSWLGGRGRKGKREEVDLPISDCHWPQAWLEQRAAHTWLGREPHPLEISILASVFQLRKWRFKEPTHQSKRVGPRSVRCWNAEFATSPGAQIQLGGRGNYTHKWTLPKLNTIYCSELQKE